MSDRVGELHLVHSSLRHDLFEFIREAMDISWTMRRPVIVDFNNIALTVDEENFEDMLLTETGHRKFRLLVQGLPDDS